MCLLILFEKVPYACLDDLDIRGAKDLEMRSNAVAVRLPEG